MGGTKHVHVNTCAVKLDVICVINLLLTLVDHSI